MEDHGCSSVILEDGVLGVVSHASGVASRLAETKAAYESWKGHKSSGISPGNGNRSLDAIATDPQDGRARQTISCESEGGRRYRIAGRPTYIKKIFRENSKDYSQLEMSKNF
jgi:hypothetical protein